MFLCVGNIFECSCMIVQCFSRHFDLTADDREDECLAYGTRGCEATSSASRAVAMHRVGDVRREGHPSRASGGTWLIRAFVEGTDHIYTAIRVREFLGRDGQRRGGSQRSWIAPVPRSGNTTRRRTSSGSCALSVMGRTSSEFTCSRCKVLLLEVVPDGSRDSRKGGGRNGKGAPAPDWEWVVLC